MKRHVWFCTASSAFVLSVLLATGPTAAWGKAGAKKKASIFSVAGDAGLGGVGGVAFATLQTGLSIREGQMAMGLFARLRIAMQSTPDGAIRKRDWDEPSDFVHLLRYFHYRHRFGKTLTAHLRLGEERGVSFGHGSIIRDYTNLADADHLHTGLRLNFDHRRFGVAAMIDNLLSPALVAGRVWFAPAAKIPQLRLGATFAIDPQAPQAISVAADGTRYMDSAFNLQADRAVGVHFGIDAEYTIGDRSAAYVTPYADLNSSVEGIGLHLGATGELPLDKRKRVRLSAQVEYNVSSAGYAPSYFGTFYDLERNQSSFSDLNSRFPKAAALARKAYGINGTLLQLGLKVLRKTELKVGYAFHPGPDAHQLWLSARVTPISRLSIGALILARGLGQGNEGAGLAAMAETRVRIFENLYGLGQYTRSWSLDQNTRYYAVLQSFNVGVGGNWSD
jgi:hypothetical protein